MLAAGSSSEQTVIQSLVILPSKADKTGHTLGCPVVKTIADTKKQETTPFQVHFEGHCITVTVTIASSIMQNETKTHSLVT